jgi:hypothetical protein
MASIRTKILPIAGLSLVASLGGCGGSSSPNSLTITCGEGVSVVGIERTDVAAPEPGNQAATATTLTYPDPVNTGHTGTLKLGPGQKCTIKPTTNTG